MQEMLGIIGFAVITNVFWFVMLLRREKLVADMAKLLASRTFSEYSIGEARLAETRREQKPTEEGYESLWERGS